jgi:hypothetical protein
MNIPSLYIHPPILFSETDVLEDEAFDDELMFSELGTGELRAKWRSLLREYSATANEFRQLERERIRFTAELVNFRSEVEVIENFVIEKDIAAGRLRREDL